MFSHHQNKYYIWLKLNYHFRKVDYVKKISLYDSASKELIKKRCTRQIWDVFYSYISIWRMLLYCWLSQKECKTFIRYKKIWVIMETVLSKSLRKNGRNLPKLHWRQEVFAVSSYITHRTVKKCSTIILSLKHRTWIKLNPLIASSA